MPDNIVKSVYKAETKDYNDQLVAMMRQNEKLIETMRKGAAEAKESHRGLTAQVEEQGKKIQNTIASLFTLEKVIDTVVEAHNRWNEKMKKGAELQEQLTRNTVGMAADLGLSTQAGQLAEMARHVRGATEAQGQDILHGIGRQDSLERAGQLADVVGGMMPLFGNDSQRARVFGERAGNMARELPGMSVGDVADYAWKFRQRTGGHDEALGDPQVVRAIGRAREMGLSEDEAFGFLSLAISKGGSPQMINKLFDKIGEEMTSKALDRYGKPSAEDVEHNKLAGMTKRQRFDYVMSSRVAMQTVMNDASAAQLVERMGGLEGVTAEGAQYAPLRRQDFIHSELLDFSETEPGGEMVRKQARELKRDQRRQGSAERDKLNAERNEAVEDAIAGNNLQGFAGDVIRGGMAAANWANYFVSGLTQKNEDTLETAMGYATGMALPGGNRSLDLKQPMNDLQAEMVRIAKAQLEEQKKANGMAERGSDKARVAGSKYSASE